MHEIVLVFVCFVVYKYEVESMCERKKNLKAERIKIRVFGVSHYNVGY